MMLVICLYVIFVLLVTNLLTAYYFNYLHSFSDDNINKLEHILAINVHKCVEGIKLVGRETTQIKNILKKKE